MLSLGHVAFAQETNLLWRWIAFKPQHSTLFDGMLWHDTIAIAVGADGVIRRGTSIDSLDVRHGVPGLPTWRYVGAYNDTVLVCAGDEGRVGWSYDDGLTWKTEVFPLTQTIRQIVQAGDDALVATDDGLYRWTPGSSRAEQLLEGRMAGVVREPHAHVAAFTRGEIVRSIDGGQTWQTDEALSSADAVVRLVQSDSTTFVVGGKMITWRNQSGAIDTLAMPSHQPARFSDIAAYGTQMFLTFDIPYSRHAYSLNGGQTMAVMPYSYPNSTHGVALSAKRFLCVGERGEVAFGDRDSAIRNDFYAYGFQPFRKPPLLMNIAGLVDVGDGIRLVTRQPDVSWYSDTSMLDRSVVLPNVPNITFPRGFEESGRQTVLMDTVQTKLINDSTTTTSYTFVAYTRLEGDSLWTRFQSPTESVSASTAFSIGNGRFLMSNLGYKQIYLLDVAVPRLDSLPLPDDTEIVYADRTLIYARGRRDFSAFASKDIGRTWLRVGSPSIRREAWSIARGQHGRLLFIEHVHEGVCRLRYSDDDAATWSDAFEVQFAANNPGNPRLYADTAGRVVAYGAGRSLAFSTDNGVTWRTSLIPPPPALWVSDVVFNRPDVLVAILNSNYLATAEIPPTTSIDDQGAPLNQADADTDNVCSLQAFDLRGRAVGSIRVGAPHAASTLLEFLQLPRGVYLVQCTTASGAILGYAHVVP
jgi:hypothetical protein